MGAGRAASDGGRVVQPCAHRTHPRRGRSSREYGFLVCARHDAHRGTAGGGARRRATRVPRRRAGGRTGSFSSSQCHKRIHHQWQRSVHVSSRSHHPQLHIRSRRTRSDDTISVNLISVVIDVRTLSTRGRRATAAANTCGSRVEAHRRHASSYSDRSIPCCVSHRVPLQPLRASEHSSKSFVAYPYSQVY